MIVRVICANRLTLTHVVKRTLDIDEQVRRAAYKFIADKIHIKSMTIAQREEIIRRGLTDRNEKVKKVVAKDLGKLFFFYQPFSEIRLFWTLFLLLRVHR